nr:MAG TPA: hypothetical protein [Caudoviricetes sp.]
MDGNADNPSEPTQAGLSHVSIRQFETIAPLANFQQSESADSFPYRRRPIAD